MLPSACAFATWSPTVRSQSPFTRRPRRVSRQTPKLSQTGDLPAASRAALIPDTPCFTSAIMATPMPTDHRRHYLDAAAEALREHLTATSRPSRAKLTLLVPQLDPELDVYDRRFLLQLLWSALSVTADLSLRTRVLIQGPRNFGAVPLSIAGLRRTFDADLALSIDDWPVLLRSGDLEDTADVDEQDDVIIVVSPTNAVSIPVVNSIRDLADRVGNRPIILLNPRLSDIPSSSGVMQVTGRAERIRLIDSFVDVFYMRLLFKAGTGFPLRGILYHAFPGPWQVWRPNAENSHYRNILSCEQNPSSEAINRALSKDTYAQQKQRLAESQKLGVEVPAASIISSPQFLIILAMVALFVASRGFGDELRSLLHVLRSGSGK